MLQFLVTSKARRLLLQLLWVEEARGSAFELAAQAGVGLATAQSELKAMHRFGLARVERDGRRDVYSAYFEHPQAEVLKALLRGGNRAWVPTDEGDDDVRGWLKEIGVPLRGAAAQSPAPPLSEVLVEGVRLARRDPTVARALPLGFWKKRDELDVGDLLRRANRPEEKHALGFFLEMTGELGGDRRLVGLSEVFRDRRLKTEHDFFLLPPTRSRQRRAAARSPDVARRWGFRMNMEREAFASLFEKFARRTAS